MYNTVFDQSSSDSYLGCFYHFDIVKSTTENAFMLVTIYKCCHIIILIPTNEVVLSNLIYPLQKLCQFALACTVDYCYFIFSPPQYVTNFRIFSVWLSVPICLSFVIRVTEQLFICLHVIFISFSVNHLLFSVAYFLLGCWSLLLLMCRNSFILRK